MDQRRLFLFLTLCFLLMIAFGPKPKPPQQPAAEDAAQLAEADPAGAAAEKVEAPGVAAEQDDASPAAPAAPAAPDNANANANAEPIVAVDAETEFVTLGSVNPQSPYRLGVTLTNRGAGIRRIELSSTRFRDLHDRGGYLGHLELAPDNRGGLRIQSLVTGSPAESAGLGVDDRIVSFSDGAETITLSSAKDFAQALAKRKPGRELTLQVARGDAQPLDYLVTLTRRPLEVIRPEIENVALRTKVVPAGITSPASFQFTFEQLGGAKLGEAAEELAGLNLRDSNWEIVEQDKNSVTFRNISQQYQVEVFKRFRLEPVPAEDQDDKNYPGYNLTLDIEIRNLGQQDVPLRYQLDGPNGLPVEGWWYANKVGRTWSAAGIRDVVARHVGNDTVQFGPTDIAADEVEVMQGPPLAFAGVDAQYFSAVLLPEKPDLEETWIDELRSISLSPKPKARSSEGRYVNATCRLISHEFDLPPKGTLKHSYEIFAGPKRPDLLANYHASESTRYGLSDLMYYGWFGPVAKAMLGILHFFYGIVGNYGLAIIMLTVLVRGCMFPISRKQAQSMAKMQELRPEMDKIKEKYKQDMQKQSQAMQELYRKYNINPLSGCLPMFIQLPIFLGLYRALMVDVELRQAPLLGNSIRWCSNLAAPDMFYDWSWMMPQFISSGEGIFGLGPYFNLLPIVTCALFILQQKVMMPEPANEQAAMQQTIMKYMMLFMGLLFFKVAAGLCIYFISTTLWGIVERKMLPKSTSTPALATATGPEPSTAIARSNGADKATRRRSKKSKKKKR
ncbi:MAG: YidC/Oxa1 family insertase periplasmic-domain containing protein [Bythopirellula sp.]